jgi:hypothetical protein
LGAYELGAVAWEWCDLGTYGLELGDNAVGWVWCDLGAYGLEYGLEVKDNRVNAGRPRLVDLGDGVDDVGREGAAREVRGGRVGLSGFQGGAVSMPA